MTDFLSFHEEIAAFLPPIIKWYRENKKNLPWRNSPTPYHVWISEIMLQQTRIEAVLSYYARFLEALPTIKALAEVEDDVLMKLWQGLGYYSRARNLKKAAGIVMERYQGNLPDSAEALRRLPGIGEYTAGAIASISFGKPEPAVDGNVLRVISRMLKSYDDIMLPRVKKDVTELLRRHYPEGEEASLLTEGLMELGETICIPNGTPRCESCPVKSLCLAKRDGVTEELPIRNVKKEKRKEEKTVILLRSLSGKYAIQKRGKTGLLADMWEFPNFEGFGAEGDVESYLAEKGIRILSAERLSGARHIFTHVVWEMQGFLAVCEEESDTFLFLTKDEILSSYAIPTAYRTYVKLMKE